MSQVTITERIYVDGNGKRVDESYKGMKTLAAVPGDVVPEARAAALGVKAKAPAENKAREQGENKGVFGGAFKRDK